MPFWRRLHIAAQGLGSDWLLCKCMIEKNDDQEMKKRKKIREEYIAGLFHIDFHHHAMLEDPYHNLPRLSESFLKKFQQKTPPKKQKKKQRQTKNQKNRKSFQKTHPKSPKKRIKRKHKTIQKPPQSVP